MSYVKPTLVASGTTFAQFQSGGVSGHLEKLIAAQVATIAPTVAATATATGGGASGGLLAAGTYYFVVTETDGFGETTIGPESAQLTVAAANIPRVTFQSLKTGNIARNLYFSALNSAAGGPYTLYASNITAGTFDCSFVQPTNSYAMKPPTINTTGLSYTDSNGHGQSLALQFIRLGEKGHLQDVYVFLRGVITDFNRGDPASFNGVLTKLRHAGGAFAALAVLCAEMGTLIDANAGTLGRSVDQIGNAKTKRSWP